MVTAFDLGRVLDALPAMVWIARPDGHVGLINHAWSHYTGLSPDDARGLEWQAVVHPDDGPALLGRWQSILASGDPGEIHARLKRFDGHYRRFRIQCSPMRDDAGHITEWCGIATDIEDVRRVEETLQRHRLDFQLVVDSIPVPVAVTAPSGEVEALNQPTLDYFGKTLEELKGWQATNVVHPDDLAATIERQADAHQKGYTYNIELRHRRADGVYRWFNVLGLPLRDGDGTILRWFHLLTDIEDRKRAEEALQTAQDKLARASQAASLAKLSASIAHEINQPLAAVMTNAQACQNWLAGTPANVQRAMASVERITQNANTVANVIDRIRALFTQCPHVREKHSINHVISEVCRLISAEAGTRRIRIRATLDEAVPPTSIDRVQLQQVIVNLLRNAMDAAEMAGDDARFLDIQSRWEGPDNVLVAVRDHGPGITDAERIFEPFFTTKRDGLGMGLSICRSIIEAHGGRLWAANAGKGGAVFSFTLPFFGTENPEG